MSAITTENLPIIPLVDDTHRGHGRPNIAQLCSIFSDDSIWQMAEIIFLRIYNYSILESHELCKFMVCYMCSLFRISSTDDPFGRVSHFHRLMKLHFQHSQMPALRTLQCQMVWYTDPSHATFRNVHHNAELAKLQAWQTLGTMIYDIMLTIAPQFTL